MKRTMARLLLCTRGGISLYETDLHSLHDHTWVTDNVIGFFFEYIQNSVDKSHDDRVDDAHDGEVGSGGGGGGGGGRRDHHEDSKPKIDDDSAGGREEKKNREGILFVPPSLTHMLLMADEEDLAGIREGGEFNFPSRQLIFLALNDAAVCEVPGKGSHWALLVVKNEAASQLVTKENRGGGGGGGGGRGGERMNVKFELYDSMSTSRTPSSLSSNPSSSSSLSSSCSALAPRARIVAEKIRCLLSPSPPPPSSSSSSSSPPLLVRTMSHGPRQTNSYDCGLFVMATAEEIITRRFQREEGEDDVGNNGSSSFRLVVERNVRGMRGRIRTLLQEQAREYRSSSSSSLS